MNTGTGTTSSSTSNNQHQHQHQQQSTNKNQKDLFNYAIADMTITTSMKELVSQSPFMDARGRFYVSMRETYLVLSLGS
jgi:hypothetical protein